VGEEEEKEEEQKGNGNLSLEDIPSKEEVDALSWKGCLLDRLQRPWTGDKVEVAWKGKFRLEALDIYQGLAWWEASVVDRDLLNNKYRIHYPGWEARWDEWVTRERLRWNQEENTTQIKMGDKIELFCSGQNVPGAWLETKVRKIRNDMYCVGKVSASTNGSIWCERHRIRKIRTLTAQTSLNISPTFFAPTAPPPKKRKLMMDIEEKEEEGANNGKVISCLYQIFTSYCINATSALNSFTTPPRLNSSSSNRTSEHLARQHQGDESDSDDGEGESDSDSESDDEEEGEEEEEADNRERETPVQSCIIM